MKQLASDPLSAAASPSKQIELPFIHTTVDNGAAHSSLITTIKLGEIT